MPVCIIRDEPIISEAIIRLNDKRLLDFSTSFSSSCNPLYGFDVPHFKAYTASAKEDTGIQGYLDHYLGSSEEEYRQNVGGLDAIRSIELPTY